MLKHTNYNLKKNVKDNKKDIEKEKFNELMKDMTKIHMSHNEEAFKKNILDFKNKYSKTHKAMYEYCATWFDGMWSNWQIYHSQPGLANTNSNIESFNRTIKRFTNRRKLGMKASCEKLFELITYYSTEYYEFEEKPKYDKKIRDVAAFYTKNCFTVVRKDKICCQGRDSKHIILLNDKSSFFKCSCTCKYFVKSAVCAHLVAYSSLNYLNLFDKRYYKEKPKKFKPLTKRGRKKAGRPKKAEAALVRDENCD
jgi:hypothetical protein